MKKVFHIILLYIFISLFIAGCGHTPAIHQPVIDRDTIRYVYNHCTNKWAIVLHGSLVIDRFRQELYYTSKVLSDIDVVRVGMYYYPGTVLGDEQQFSSKEEAVNEIAESVKQQNENAARHQREEKAQDSIFKCQHTYK